MFDVLAGNSYWVVLGGVTLTNGSCASGTTVINYRLSAAPSFTRLPVSQTLSNGDLVTLTFAATGTPALGYQWRLNGTNIPGATSTSLGLTNFQATSQGSYSILVTNGGGVNLFEFAPVYLNSQLRLIDSVMVSNSFYSQLLGLANTTYIIQASSNLTTWVPMATNTPQFGVLTFGEPMTAGHTNRFYRAKRF